MLTGRHDEQGFTAAELVTATTISLIICVALLTVIPTFIKAQVATSNSDSAAAVVRTAMLQLQHDIQSADPLDQLGTVSAFNDELQVTLSSGGATSTVTWALDPASGDLTRQVGTSAPIIEVTGVTNGVVPVFSYYGQHDQNLVTAGAATPASVANCTILVQVTLAVAGVHAAPNASTTSIQLQNRSPGSISCG